MYGKAGPDNFAAARRKMVEYHLRGRDITDPAVLKVMAQVPREQFIPESYRAEAYSDCPLPIGMGQTISQPYIVALMTQELRLNDQCEVLEIGTGSGYQTAILSRLAKKVYTIEKYNQLSESAQAVLGRLGYDNVEFYIGDGSCGWPEERQFDRVIVTAAVPQVPEPLLAQLVTGGILVAPVGSEGGQQLVACEKRADRVVERTVCGVRFVRLVGKYGFTE